MKLRFGKAPRWVLGLAAMTMTIVPFGTKRLDRAGWQALVESMVAKGAVVPDQDMPILLDYLVKNFNPQVPLPAAPGGRGGRGGAAAVAPEDAAAVNVLN